MLLGGQKKCINAPPIAFDLCWEAFLPRAETARAASISYLRINKKRREARETGLDNEDNLFLCGSYGPVGRIGTGEQPANPPTGLFTAHFKFLFLNICCLGHSLTPVAGARSIIWGVERVAMLT